VELFQTPGNSEHGMYFVVRMIPREKKVRVEKRCAIVHEFVDEVVHGCVLKMKHGSGA
jgi:hypothetical protein